MKKTLTRTQQQSSVFEDGSVNISASLSAKVSAGYQTVSYMASASGKVPATSVKKGFNELWQLCTDQVSEQLGTAEEALSALLEVKDCVEQGSD